MKNRVGPPVSGPNYFDRPDLHRRFCRRLHAGENLYLSAPRRSGKTSFMFHLQEEPCTGYEFVYINVESERDTQTFFKRILEEMMENGAVKKAVGTSHKVKEVFESALGKIKSIDLKLFKIDLNSQDSDNYAKAFAELLQKLDPAEFKLALLIDEFPAAVVNIAQKHGDQEAIHFLQENRTIRQISSQAVQIVYTGSIGLPALVNRLRVPELINDLNVFEVPPFTEMEASKLAEQLLKAEGVSFDEDVIQHILDRVQWLMPFFIQLIVSDLVDRYEQTGKRISTSDVDAAIELSSSQRSKSHFDSYFTRLDKGLGPEKAELANQMLHTIAKEGIVPLEQFYAGLSEADKNIRRYVLGSLEFDGYISLQADGYRFNSPILQSWWLRYAF